MSASPAPRIDAHMHWWSIARDDYGWLTPDLGVLYRDYGPAEAVPLLKTCGIDGVVLVQAAQAVAETRYLLEMAHAAPCVRGVVGWVDLTAPAQLSALATDKLLVGIRPMLQDLPDDDWILRRDVTPGLRLIEELGLVFDTLVYPRHLASIIELVERHPDLNIIIDHGAKPDIAAGQMQPWKSALAQLAAIPHVHCKLSGLVNEAKEGAGPDDLAPFVDAIFELFGANRVVWGSDWPVVTQRLDYVAWWQWARQLTEALRPREREAVFGGTASRFYRLSAQA